MGDGKVEGKESSEGRHFSEQGERGQLATELWKRNDSNSGIGKFQKKPTGSRNGDISKRWECGQSDNTESRF